VLNGTPLEKFNLKQ